MTTRNTRNRDLPFWVKDLPQESLALYKELTAAGHEIKAEQFFKNGRPRPSLKALAKKTGTTTSVAKKAKKSLGVNCILIVDRSGSMSGKPGQAAMEGINNYIKELQQTSTKEVPIEVAFVEFYGGNLTKTSFVPVANISPRTSYPCNGGTPLNNATLQALSLWKTDRLKTGKQYIISIFTDGDANDWNLNPSDIRPNVIEAREAGVMISAQGAGRFIKSWSQAVGIDDSNVQAVDVSTSEGIFAAYTNNTVATINTVQRYAKSGGTTQSVGFFAD